MKWLTRLKSEKQLPCELPKPPKDPFDSFGSSESRHFPENIAVRQSERDAIQPFSLDCFSPDGLLEETFREALAGGWTDDRLLTLIDELVQTSFLKSPWGFKVKDSLFVGDFWIIGDTTAKEKLPAGAKSFTLDELRPIVEAFRVFTGAELINVQL